MTALGDGELLRLGKQDFNELLREPLLQRVGFEDAAGARAARRAVAGRALSLGIPVRPAAGRDQRAARRGAQHVSRCSTARSEIRGLLPERPAQRRGGAFLFAQRGFKVWLLEGGLRAAESSREIGQMHSGNSC